MAIHATAQVDPSARIGDGVEIGAWSIVGPSVVLEAGVRLASHVLIVQDTTLGVDTTVHPFAVVGGDPQHSGYNGETTRLTVGARCLIREHATLNRGTPGGGGVTHVGNGCMLMTGAHVGHDARVGNNVTFANSATLGGHAKIGDRVFLGGLSAVHQFGRVGAGAMIGGLAAVTRDVIPYGSAWGNHARLHGLNLVGLKRKGYGKSEMRRLLAAYRELFEGEGVFSDRLNRVENDFVDLSEIMEIVAFIRAGERRPLCLPTEG